MRKLRAGVCLLLVGLMIPAAMWVRGLLPVDVQPLIEKKYGGWAGTLRLWVCAGWPTGAGSAAGWLNRCIASFEKRHPGVYIQPEGVDAGALRDLGADGILPPDLILFPPGVLADGSALSECAPVMLGGYLWAYNADLLPGIPEDPGLAAIPADEPFRLWSAAALALSVRQESAEAPEAPAGEVDLGLTAMAPAAADAFKAFVNGEVPATIVTQREVRRLQALDEGGRGVHWRLAGWAGPMFIDQALYLGVVDRGGGEPEALCRAFAEHLLSDACQGALNTAGAFAVTDASSGYAAGDPLAVMDAALRAGDLLTAPPFGTGWRSAAESIVREFSEEGADPAALWPRLKAALEEKPNIPRQDFDRIRVS